jgi:hypothetical protein
MVEGQHILDQALNETRDLLPDAPKLSSPTENQTSLLIPAEAKPEELYIQFADFHEQYVSQYIELADTKAGVTFTFVSTLLGYLLATDGFRWPATLEIRELLFDGAVLLLTISASMAFYVVAPRSRRSQQDNFVSWRAVADSTVDDFLCRVTESSAGTITQAKLVHCYDLAKVCAAKYSWLRRSMFIGVAGVILGFATFSLSNQMDNSTNHETSLFRSAR